VAQSIRLDTNFRLNTRIIYVIFYQPAAFRPESRSCARIRCSTIADTLVLLDGVPAEAQVAGSTGSAASNPAPSPSAEAAAPLEQRARRDQHLVAARGALDPDEIARSEILDGCYTRMGAGGRSTGGTGIGLGGSSTGGRCGSRRIGGLPGGLGFPGCPPI
jgi:hypothetical protein